MPSRNATVAVAFSGGRDSLALLHVTAHAAAASGIEVVALHVHHGLMVEADGWVRSATALCARWRRRGLPVRLRWHRVSDRPSAGESLEAWARHQRYAALTRMAKEEGASLVLLGQHRRDQAETVLLQAFRGAGPRGLSAMPGTLEREGIIWARPWLGHGREAIEAYVRRHRLKSIEDPSNQDVRLARNRLRHEVWPSLSSAFPGLETRLRLVADRAQEAATVLAEVAHADLNIALDHGALRWQALAGLSDARRANALRHWLEQGLGAPPVSSLVRRLLTEVRPGTAACWPATSTRQVCLHRGRLSIEEVIQRPTGTEQAIDLSRLGRIEVPSWAGCFVVDPARGPGGVAPELLRLATLRARSGGERFQGRPGAIPRSLKKQYQSAGVPTTARAGPLVWAGAHLVFVPGLGIDARTWSSADPNRITLCWLPHPA